MMWGYGYGYPMMYGGLFSLLWFILLIVIAVAIVRWAMRGRRAHRWMGEKIALDILKERYAKGEIDKKEFEEKKKDLS